MENGKFWITYISIQHGDELHGQLFNYYKKNAAKYFQDVKKDEVSLKIPRF